MASTSDISEGSTSPHHPDLSNEVAALSIKLIRAINNQTALDDTLAGTRQELEKVQNRLHVVELENERFRNDIAAGVLTKRSDVDQELSSLKAQLVDERVHRVQIEKDKKNMEQELENLTAALFEEANQVRCGRQQNDSNSDSFPDGRSRQTRAGSGRQKKRAIARTAERY